MNENRAGPSASGSHPGLQTGAVANEKKDLPRSLTGYGLGSTPSSAARL